MCGRMWRDGQSQGITSGTYRLQDSGLGRINGKGESQERELGSCGKGCIDEVI